jgi:hypothetical protein
MTDEMKAGDSPFRASMAAAFDEIEARDDAVEAAKEEIEAVEEAPADDEIEQGASPDEEDHADGEAEQPDGADAVEPPDHWSAEERERFNAISDPEARRMVLDVRQSIERGYNRKFEDLAEERRQLSEWDKVFEPVDSDLKLAGVSRSQAVQRLLTAQQVLEKTPEQGIRWLAQQYGVDLNNMNPAPHEEVDPQYAGLQQKIGSIESTVNGFLTQQQQAQVQAVQQQIEQFKSATDANGNPLHPHFDKVQAHMAALAEKQPGADLDALYDQAVYAHPETRAAMLTEREKAAKAEAEKAAKEKARKARNASTPKGGSGGKEAPRGRTMRETMELAYEASQTGS